MVVTVRCTGPGVGVTPSGLRGAAPSPHSRTCAAPGTVASTPLTASARTPLLLLCVPSRRLLSLEQGRGNNIHPPLSFFEYLREPRCPKELVRACPMAGGMKPPAVLVQRL